MSKKRKHRRVRSFNPDEITTAISQNLNRDLSTAELLYGGENSVQRYYRKAQGEATLKKYVSPEASTDELQEEAFKAFLATNERMGLVNENFRWPRDLQARHLTSHELLLKRARALVHWVLGKCWWSEICHHASHSGGVTQGVKFTDTSIEAKFTWPISTTREAALLWKDYLAENEELSAAIQDLNRHQPLAERYDFYEGSRATTVPKSNTKRRMIAIEPTLNMYFQQALMEMMYDRLKMVGLDVESLPNEHQELAWRGSVTGNLATIDFSSASDCVSIELLRYLLPADWFEVLDMVRCPVMEMNGRYIELNMFSTMGNAGTFPLETLIFWSLGVGTVMHFERSNPNSLLSLPEERAKVSVFGDDCILPTDYASFFMDVCESVGFLVNKEKSFYARDARFRESCGGDYLHGSNVRPVCIQAPTTVRMSGLEPWLYIILNGILKKYISYFGPTKYVYDKDLLRYLFSLFRRYQLKVKLVPSYFPDDAGLKTSDWQRLRACYGVVFDKVACSDHGTWSFKYCRFVYRHKQERHDHTRYALWLGKPTFSSESKARRTYPIRKKGGYVVAKGISSCWSL